MEKNSYKVKSTKIYELPEYHKWICEGPTNLEFEIIKPGTSSELLRHLVENDSETMASPFGLVPSLNVLFSIKDSHKYKKFETPRGCSNFYKHALDWHIMKSLGAELKLEHETFRKKRELETYTNVLPKLNVSAMNFFDSEKNGVIQTFIHDDLHKVVAINDRAAYEYYLKDNSEVMCSKEKFFEASEFIRLSGVCEEAMVLGLERSLIPHTNVWSPEYAWKFALAKVATSITGGYFRKFAFNNLFKIMKMYPEYCENYYNKFQDGVKSGMVRRTSDTEILV